MSKWVGKYVIGLTGNIGTGKSVVRRMLEHLGAYGIDADRLAHRVMAKGAPGYAPVVRNFGRWILAPDGQIDRAKLGKLVFVAPEALASLENIVHPLVVKALDYLIAHSTHTVVVIEAIKLIEAGLHKDCDSLWVTYAPFDLQMARLVQKRGLSAESARQRIESQLPQSEKVAAANVVIKNTGSFTDTWNQVAGSWERWIPLEGQAAAVEAAAVERQVDEISVMRGGPRHAAQIAGLINRVSAPEKPLNQDDIMAAFGERAFLLLHTGDQLSGVMGWQVENLVARTTGVVLEPRLAPGKALPPLIEEMERASRDLQCEASLVFVSGDLAGWVQLWHDLGYEPADPHKLVVQAWKEAASESMPGGATMFFKRLRQDRVLRPI
ncbi:MAG TPA: dephospho-CoA kinase [Levilinea sp.]|nr:dephospho-CoA kinase [Levilinea sp.]